MGHRAINQLYTALTETGLQRATDIGLGSPILGKNQNLLVRIAAQDFSNQLVDKACQLSVIATQVVSFCDKFVQQFELSLEKLFGICIELLFPLTEKALILIFYLLKLDTTDHLTFKPRFTIDQSLMNRRNA